MKKLFSFIFAACMAVTAFAEVYTVAGEPAALFGTEWDPANTANVMTEQADGTYKWEKKDFETAAMIAKFKVVKGSAWGTEYPSSNYELKIAKSGKYTITITFNPNGNKVDATATLQQEVEIIPSIAIAGEMNGWSTTANTFTMAADKKTASLTLNLEAKDYGFKMIIAGSWTNDGQVITRENNSAVYTGANVDANGTLTADIAGEYTFTWTYATSTLVVTYPALAPDPEQPGDTTVTPTPDPEPETGVTYNVTVPTGTNACYIAGDMNGWSFTEMTKVDATHYTITIETATKADGYKYASGADWKYVEKGATGEELGNRVWSENDVVATWAAVYVPEVTPDPEPETGVTYNVTVPTGTNACYIAGDMNGWSFTEMTKVDDTHYTITIETATKADGYKYASGADWKYVEKGATGEELGNRVWSENDVVATWAAVYVPETVGFENIEATENPVKFIENGKLYIIREGNVYDATGARVK